MADDALNIANNANSQMMGNHGVIAGFSRNMTDSSRESRLGGRQFKNDARLQKQRYENEAQLSGYRSQLKREEMTHGGNLTQYGKSMDHGIHDTAALSAAGGNIGAGISSSRRASEYRDAEGNVAGEVSAKYGNVQTGGYKLPARKAAENPNAEGQQFGTPESRKKGAKLEKSEGIPFKLSDAKEEPGTPVDTPTTRLMQKERLEQATDVVMPKRAKKAPAKKKKQGSA
jgi:hypothetical protein